jgi:hypothetical protein
MRHIIITTGLAALLACSVQAQFSAGKLAVLRAGDNGTNQNNTSSPSDLGGAHQAPTFIDEFDPIIPINISTTNMGANGPLFSVAIPTNDPMSGPPAAMWFNGHAGTEGYLSRSEDASVVLFSGYGGNIEAQQGTPSDLNIPRGICVIDVSGNNHIAFEGTTWYGLGSGAQTNPRGVTSDDGTNNFWGSGSLDGTEWYNPIEEAPPVTIENLGSSRQVKIINGTFYVSLQESDGNGLYPQGIYNLITFDGSFPAALPEGGAFFLNLVIPASSIYANVDGFDINPKRNVAYLADDSYGIVKYAEINGTWQLQCVFAFTNHFDTSPPSFGTYPIGYSGAFGLVVDWSQTNPVLFATTTEELGSFINSNRLIRLVDNYSFTDGQAHDVSSNIITLATAWSTNVVFRGLAWAPNRAPVITTNPASQSVVLGTPVSFTVGVTPDLTNTTYEWFVNGLQDPTMTNSTYSVAAALLNGNYQVIVSNSYGSATSLVATLTVTASAVAPVLTSPVPPLNLSNAVYDPITIPVTASGTTPLSYSWYFANGSAIINLSDGGDYYGTATGTLGINISSSADAGSYYVVINNSAGTPSSNLVATLTVVTPLPNIFSQPIDTTVASNGITSLSVAAYPLGNNCSYQWYQGGLPMSDIGGHWTGCQGPTLTDLDAQANDSTNYFVVVSDAGGSVTSVVVTITVAAPAPFSVLPYTALGQVYKQNFDTMPDPGTVFVNNSTTTPTAPLPVTIGNVTYDVSNPFDFAAPLSNSVVSIGTNHYGFGGLNEPAMAGWYSSDLGNEQIQATSGNSTTGLIVSFGCLLTNGQTLGGFPYNPLYPTNNRALGMICSPATSTLDTAGTTADAVFALRIENLTGQTLTNFNLSYASELWRNTSIGSPVATGSILTNFYYVDPLGTNATPTNNVTGFLTNLTFSTNIGTTASLTQINATNAPIAITNMAFVNVPLATPCPQGGILWLVWEESICVSKGQGLGIDNLVFSSGLPTLAITPGQPNLSYSTNAPSGAGMVTLSWPQMFTSAVLVSSTNLLANPASWQPVGVTPTVWQGINYVTLPVSGTEVYFTLQN